jgi:hypothetical protein
MLPGDPAISPATFSAGLTCYLARPLIKPQQSLREFKMHPDFGAGLVHKSSDENSQRGLASP